MDKIKTWFLTTTIWAKLWPLSIEIFSVVSDGKVTREEIKKAVDAVFGDRDTIVLWKGKE